MLLEEVPVTQSLLHDGQLRVVVLDCFDKVTDRLFAVFTFDIYIESANIFDVADSLGIKQDLILELTPFFVIKGWVVVLGVV